MLKIKTKKKLTHESRERLSSLKNAKTFVIGWIKTFLNPNLCPQVPIFTTNSIMATPWADMVSACRLISDKPFYQQTGISTLCAGRPSFCRNSAQSPTIAAKFADTSLLCTSRRLFKSAINYNTLRGPKIIIHSGDLKWLNHTSNFLASTMIPHFDLTE